jgi:hypothetical protein
MNPRNTFALVLITGAIFAFIFLVEPHFEKPKPGPLRVLPDFNTNAVTTVQILTPQFEIRAERSEHGWRLVKPLAYPAQAATVEGFLAVAAGLAPQFQISAQELQGRVSVNEEYGLDTPMATLVFQRAGESPRQLKLGKFTAPGDGIYVQVVGDSTVDVIDAGFYKQFIPHTANDWRDSTFFEVADAGFDHLTVASGAQTFDLQRDAAHPAWRMTKPVLTRADSPKIEGLLNKLRGVSVTNFVTDSPQADFEGYGLQPGALEIKLIQGTNPVATLQFGKSPTNSPAMLYARHGGQSTVVLVPRASIEPWQKGYQEFRDPHLVRLVGNLPDAIQAFAQDRELFTVERRTNDSWQVVRPYDFPADTNLMWAFLENLNALEVLRSNNEVAVKDTVLPDADFPRYGLKTPSRSYVLKRADKIVIAELDFGLEEEGKVYVRRGDQPEETSVYAVRSEDFRKLPASAFQLHACRIWNFLEDDVVSVSLRQKGATIKMIRQGQYKWQSPPGVDDIKLEMGAMELGALDAENWVSRGDQERAKYGFSEKSPRLTADIQINGKAQTLALDFGGVSPRGLHYGDVKLDDGQNWIFEFSAREYDRLTAYFPIEENPTP